MKVYQLWVDDYESGQQIASYATLEEAQAAIPGALWREQPSGTFEAFHPDYPEYPWQSESFMAPAIVPVELGVMAEYHRPDGPETPRGPMFGPPLPPGCKYRQESPQMACGLFEGHDGPHDLHHASWTSSSFLVTSSGLTDFAMDGSISSIAFDAEPYGTETEY